MEEEKTIKQRYDALSEEREPYLRRARANAKVTIPTLFPEAGQKKGKDFYQTYQSFGAKAVNGLGGKLLMALVPPNQPFYRYRMSKDALQELSEDPEAKAVIDSALADYEREVQAEIEESGDRTDIYEAARQLIVAGNAMLHETGEGLRHFRLDSFVVNRDPMGVVLEIIVVETYERDSLPSEFADKIPEKAAGETKPGATVDVYTHVVLDDENDKMYLVYQEADGEMLLDKPGSYRKDELPWIPLRWTKIPGESYGRAMVEEVYGDLYSLEGLYRAGIQTTAAMSKLLFLVNPNGTTNKQSLAKARNGSFVTGNAGDVSALQSEKAADLNTMMQMVGRIEERLAAAFLMNQSVTREAERVTAEEIRYMANELDDSLGGVYSILSQEFQLPYLRAKIASMPKLPKLPKDAARPRVVTGLEALGRGNDLTKLDLYLAGMQQTLGPEAVQKWMNVGTYLTMRATALGIDTTGLIKSQEEVAQAEQQAQMAAMVQQLGPEAMKQLGPAMAGQGGGDGGEEMEVPPAPEGGPPSADQ